MVDVSGAHHMETTHRDITPQFDVKIQGFDLLKVLGDLLMQESALPAREDGGYVRRNRGQTHTFLRRARRAFCHAPTVCLTSPSPGNASFPQPVADGTCRAADVWRAVESSSP